MFASDRRANMKRLLTLNAAALSCAAFFGAAAPAAAKDYEYCRRGLTSANTCHSDVAAIASAIRRSAAAPTRTSTHLVSARRTPTHRIVRNSRGSRGRDRDQD